MEPSITILTIQNPGEDAVVINPFNVLTPDGVVENFGGQIKHGAFVTLIDREHNGNTIGGLILVADRAVDGRLYLQNNERLSEDNSAGANIDDIGAVVVSGDVPLETPPEELETFTVFGKNDDNENFVAVIAATEETAQTVGVQAGLVDAGYEESVIITAILKGDQSHLERVSI